MPLNEETPTTVLVVEDDAALRMLCRINLDLEGYRVLEAETMDRAAELVSSEPVDVVLLDLHVGERHGRFAVLPQELGDAIKRLDVPDRHVWPLVERARREVVGRAAATRRSIRHVYSAKTASILVLRVCALNGLTM